VTPFTGAASQAPGGKRHTKHYKANIKPFRWAADKNDLLKRERGVSFEKVVVAIEAGGLMDVLAHPNPARYPHQKVLVVRCDYYVHLVPFVEESDRYFVKTSIPSRKATRDYLKKGESHARTRSRRSRDS
jgi:hypothetical protein